MSPVGSLGFLESRSRTVPVIWMADSLFSSLKAFHISSLSMTTWVTP